MSSEPVLSVVMSVFNGADTLRAALDSILAQEGVPFECIVVDDGSTDCTPAILKAYAARDARVRIITQSNTGLTRALIAGCERARGQWIVRHDADDVSLPGRFRSLHALCLRHTDAVLLATSSRFVGPSGEPLYELRADPDTALARHGVLDGGRGPPGHGSVMFSRAAYHAVGGYRACFYFGQDSDLWMRLAERGGVAYEAGVYYVCRFDPARISGAFRTDQRAFGRYGQACRALRRAGQDESAVLAEAAAHTERIRAGQRAPGSKRDQATAFYHIGSLLLDRDPRAARVYFGQAFRTYPLFIRAAAKWCAAAIRA